MFGDCEEIKSTVAITKAKFSVINQQHDDESSNTTNSDRKLPTPLKSCLFSFRVLQFYYLKSELISSRGEKVRECSQLARNHLDC